MPVTCVLRVGGDVSADLRNPSPVLLQFGLACLTQTMPAVTLLISPLETL